MTALDGLRVAVIGAGFGGLAAAAHLAHEGAHVTVLEKARAVGGKAARLGHDGFVFDSGPTLLTMPEIARETFDAAGTPLDAIAPLRRVEPACSYVFPGGHELTVTSDTAATRAAIARIDRRDADHWAAFLGACRQIWDAAGEAYLEAPFGGFVDLARRVLRRGRGVTGLVHARGTLHDFARRHFRSRELVTWVDHFSTYAGTSPTRASAAMAMIAHAEVGLGAFYPQGGMHALADALARAVERRGVRVLRGVEATSIAVDSAGRASAVTTRSLDGLFVRRIEADAIVANVDPLVVVSRLVPEASRRAAGLDALCERAPSLSGFGWAFGIEGPVPTSTLHTLFFAPDLNEELRDVFDRRAFGSEPSVWVSVPTHLDPARAPVGHHTVFALLFAPATADAVDWSKEAPRLRRAILARLEREWGGGLERRIRAEALVTPHDIAQTGSPDGALYGAAPNGAFGAFARPSNRARGIKGLYFAGGATHPGGGVTLAMRSGRFARDLIAGDLQDGRICAHGN